MCSFGLVHGLFLPFQWSFTCQPWQSMRGTVRKLQHLKVTIEKTWSSWCPTVAISHQIFNRFRGDSAANLQSALRFQIARCYCDFNHLKSLRFHGVLQGGRHRGGRNFTSFLRFSRPFFHAALFYLKTCTLVKGSPLKHRLTIAMLRFGLLSEALCTKTAWWVSLQQVEYITWSDSVWLKMSNLRIFSG